MAPPNSPAAVPASRVRVYEPPGPAVEALSSCYVRGLVQRAIDQAFRPSPPAPKDDPAVLSRRDGEDA